MDVRLVEHEAFAVVGVRHHGPIAAIPGTFAALWQWIGQRSLNPRVKLSVGLCYGDLRNDPNARYYAGVVFDPVVEPDGPAEALAVPAGRWAEHRLLGPYSQMETTFRRLYCEWLPTSGHAPDGGRPAMEIYRNSPMSTPPAELITDLLVPIL